MTEKVTTYREIKPAAACRYDGVALGVDYTLLSDPSDVFDTPANGEFSMFHGGTKLEDTKAALNAKATIALQGYCVDKSLDYAASKGQEIVKLHCPIGITATDKFLMELSRVTGKPIPAELELEREGLRIRVRHEVEVRTITTTVADQGTSGSTSASQLTGAAGVQTEDTTGMITIASPIVGTFYRSPSPDADPYVEEGDYVKKGQVLCIVEAMKLMNEIESEVEGRVTKILAESTKPVEYGQALFLVDPTATP